MGDVPHTCHGCWSCCQFWQLLPGMNNKIIIILHQREGEQFVESIKNWAKDCPLMRWKRQEACSSCWSVTNTQRGPGGRGSHQSGRQGWLSWMHICILTLIIRWWAGDRQNSRAGAGRVCVCHPWFILHRPSNIALHFFTWQKEKWRQWAYHLLVGEWQLPHCKTPAHWWERRSNFIGINVPCDDALKRLTVQEPTFELELYYQPLDMPPQPS